MKNMQGHCRAEATCHHKHYKVHPPIKEEVFFKGDHYTEVYRDDLLPSMVQLGNHL
jgi:hypothetical protein